MKRAGANNDAIVDAAAREQIRSELDTTFVVEAAAGTGKTTELVLRIVALLARGERLSHMVAVTFTDKAAGELKLRLRAAIEDAREAAGATGERRENLDKALSELETARIGTIHSFCTDLLRERPVEARVDPAFQHASEGERSAMLSRAFGAWFERQLADPPMCLLRLLARKSADRTPRERLLHALSQLDADRDYDAPWQPSDFDMPAAVDAILGKLLLLESLLAESKKTSKMVRQTRQLTRVAQDAVAGEALSGIARDHVALEAELLEFDSDYHDAYRLKGSARDFPPGVHGEALELRDTVRADIAALARDGGAQLAAQIRELLLPALDEVRDLKRAAGKLDFVDLLIRARDLLVRDAEVRASWQSLFTHIFVDEFQDTDPLQAEILLLLAARTASVSDYREVEVEPGKLFVVGDPKQSIYRFRRADVTLYARVKEQLVRGGARLLHLETSFRAVPNIQRLINAAFEPVMRGGGEEGEGGGNGAQAEYVPLRPYRQPTGKSSQPSVVMLPAPRPKVWQGGPTKSSVNLCAPAAVAAFVRYLIHDSGYTVREDEEDVPIAARHIALLFRSVASSFSDPVGDHVRELEKRGVPHRLLGGRSYHAREEVRAMRTALTAIEWPSDALSVYAVLHGPFFALPDDALLAYTHRVGPLNPVRPTLTEEEAAELPPEVLEVARALDVLGSLHAGRNRRPISDTIMRLLRRTRAHAALAFWPAGEQALANVLRIVDEARRFEAEGATSFRAFVTLLEARIAGGDADGAVVDDGSDGVRLMTVHKAKGLEYPVVILCHPTYNPVRRKPDRYIDSDRRLAAYGLCGCLPRDLLDHESEVLKANTYEAERLLYVAATRARDMLVLPAVATKPPEGWWLSTLYGAAYPELARWAEPEPLADHPPFGRQGSLNQLDLPTITPGLHRVGDAEVVWWDPAWLEDGAGDVMGSRYASLLKADEAHEHANAGLRAHDEWAVARREAVREASEPTHRATSATAHSKAMAGLVGEGAASGGVDIDMDINRDAEATSPPGADAARALDFRRAAVVRTDASQSPRPRGARFGSLVHMVMAEIALDADEPMIRAQATAHGRLLGNDPPEVEAAVSAVRAALAHPIMRRAHEAQRRGGLRRETPMLLRHAGVAGAPDVLVEGIVDLAFEEDDAWTVVDFKTDLREIDAADHYHVQVWLYARAISAATGKPARTVLLGV